MQNQSIAMSTTIEKKKTKFKKKKYRRYFRYFLLGIAFMLLALQLYFSDFQNIWKFDNMLPIAVLVAIILSLIVMIFRSKRYHARKRALKRKQKLVKK
ncbi:hypothetical protein [Sediminibacter sp. Hel_I_10]|uniref:hypothetical protein n=1 Tax=Sediminibacter sp. Hel_I_10 TaxID=1392490 RepID=UPI0012DCDE7A|nr:hypothetical protein [Sediminibacter sp. Hel_I_10]